jgi:uncharacterized protein
MDRKAQVISAVQRSRFRHEQRLIQLFIGGSELHGAKIQDTDDLDIYGVYVEPPESVLGLDRDEFFVWSTAGNERRNGPDDIDITLYSLRKWASLAVKGNPTALHFLFAPNYSDYPEPWHRIEAQREIFLSKQAANQFRGFADAQLRRLQGIGTGKRGQRHEYVGQHGYDTKAAMHTVRLLHEGIELMQRGTITLPRPEKQLLTSIRTGEYGSLEQVLGLANQLFAVLTQAENAAQLSDTVERDRVSKIIGETYLSAWESTR